jgi:hypothetical protein
VSHVRGKAPDDYVRLSAHPRAQRSIARAKSLGGLIGFLVGLYLASNAGLPAWDTGLRALVAGVTGYLLVWLVAVQLWRQIALAEYRAAEKVRIQRIEEYNEKVRQLHEERMEALDAAREEATS